MSLSASPDQAGLQQSIAELKHWLFFSTALRPIWGSGSDMAAHETALSFLAERVMLLGFCNRLLLARTILEDFTPV
jgi:hypothetical protein